MLLTQHHNPNCQRGVAVLVLFVPSLLRRVVICGAAERRLERRVH